MAWTTPHVFVVGEMLTAAQMNAIGANLNYLKSGVGLSSFVTAGVGPTSGTTELVLATSPTYTADGTTLVEVTFTWYNITRTVAGDVFVVKLYDGPTAGSGTLLSEELPVIATNSGGGIVRAPVTPSAGSHTYTARIQQASGTGTASLVAAASTPAIISIFQAN